MSNQRLIPLLEQIRDQQKQQLANYEQALAAQQDATRQARHGQRVALFLLAMPWLLVVCLLLILVLGRRG